MPRIAFILEVGLGHTTFGHNVHAAVARDRDIEPIWIPISFEKRGVLAHLPKLRRDIVFRAGFQALFKFWKATRGVRVDSIFVHTQMPSVFLSGIMRRIPTAISLDATPVQFLAMGGHYGLNTDPDAPLNRRNFRWYNRSFAAARKFFPWSQWAADSLVSDYNVYPGLIAVCRPGVDLQQWQIGSDEAGAIVRLLFVGGDFERKGGQLLLRWLRERRDAGIADFEVHVVTRDAALRDEPNLKVHHNMENNSFELTELFQACQIFVLPTLADCNSLVAVEAMASGLPVVITRVGAIPDLVEEGTTGFLIPPGEYEPMAAALERLCSSRDLRIRMAQAGRRRAELLYNGPRNLDAMIGILRSMAKK